MLTISLHNAEFQVREDALETIQNLSGFRNIQEMLCVFFDEVEDVRTDEYALAVAVYFPSSKAWDEDKRHGRCVADVRKYNQAEFKCQSNEPETKVKHLDQGMRRSQADPEAAKKALEAISKQLKK